MKTPTPDGRSVGPYPAVPKCLCCVRFTRAFIAWLTLTCGTVGVFAILNASRDVV